MVHVIPSFYTEVTMEKQNSHKFTLSEEICKGVLGNHGTHTFNH